MLIFRARTLQKYVFREFIKTFALALSACVLLFLIVMMFVASSQYEEYGITVGQVALLSP